MKKIMAVGIIFIFLLVAILPNINADVLHLTNVKKNLNSSWLKDRCKYIKEEISDDQRLKVSTINNLPGKIDWREHNGKNWMTSVKNQGICGSCSAFAINAVIEAKINIQNNNPKIDRDLSEAHIFFCNDNDCDGGSSFSELASSIKNDGVCDELSFPYGTAEIGETLNCDLSRNWRCNAVSIKGYKYLDPDIDNIKNALITYGPLSASMDVYVNFELYIGGIYDDPVGDVIGCHAVCIVGYDEEDQCWICKNSWTKLWGESGYFRIKYGVCEIEKDVKLITQVYDLYPGTPDIPDKPSGSLIVEPNHYGDFKTKSYDPNDDKIRYLWDWDGDFNVDFETSYIESGEECNSVNKWDEEGTYKIRVRSEDKNGLKSDWSHPLTVSVKKSRQKNRFLFYEMWEFPLLRRIFK